MSPLRALSAAVTLLVLFTAVPEASSRDDGPSLPQWKGGDQAAPLGGGLWPEDFRPDSVVHPAAPAGPLPGNGAANDDGSWLRFLPRGLFEGVAPQSGPPEVQLEEVTGEVLRACDHAPPDTRLLDPEGILTGSQGEDMARFLSFHAERSGIPAYLLVLDARQKLPADAGLMHIASGSLVGKPACVVVYPMGAPLRARIFLTQAASQGADTAYLHGLSAACIRDAVETEDPFEQLQRFAMQLSIRLSWLERAYPVAAARPVSKPSANVAAHPETLREVTPAPAASWGASKAGILWRQWQRIVFAAIAGFAAVAVAMFFLLRWHRRRRRQIIWLLPEYDHRHPVRFGGPHCGGCGASVKYG